MGPQRTSCYNIEVMVQVQCRRFGPKWNEVAVLLALELSRWAVARGEGYPAEMM